MQTSALISVRSRKAIWYKVTSIMDGGPISITSVLETYIQYTTGSPNTTMNVIRVLFLPSKYLEPICRRALNCRYTYTTAKHLVIVRIRISELFISTCKEKKRYHKYREIYVRCTKTVLLTLNFNLTFMHSNFSFI